MSALTSLVRLSTGDGLNMIASFFIAVSEVEPVLSHVDTLVDALGDSDPEKQYFRTLAGLARATTFRYRREDVPCGFMRSIRGRLIQLLDEYRYVTLLPVHKGTEVTCNLGLENRIFSLPSRKHAISKHRGKIHLVQ